MEGSQCIAVATVAVAVILLIFERLLRRLKSSIQLPPGPKKLPVIGNLHQLGGMIHVTLAQMAQKHGPIMTVWFGMKPTIVLSSHELAWEVLVKKASDFASRGLPFSSQIITADWRTVIASDFGPYWQSLRKGLQASALNPVTVSLQMNLREKDIDTMIQRLQEEAASNNGVVHPFIHIRLNVVRIAARLCFGPDFDNESFVQAMNTAVIDASNLGRHTSFLDAFPITASIPVVGRAMEMAHEVTDRAASLINPEISRYISSDSPCPNCYLHFLLPQNYPKQVLIALIFEVFLLSVDSTSWMAAWALAFLVNDQQAQQKLYEEVSGRGGERSTDTVGLDQVSRFTYLLAVMKETMRLKPFAPLAIPHKAVRDTTLMGMKIAKGTNVLVNLYPVQRDPKVWDDPDQFMPERFLNQHERDPEVAKAMEQAFLPFGAGRRACAGMELAKLQVGLTLANLVNKFQWRPVHQGDGIDLSEAMSMVITMKTPIVARISPRL